MRRPGWTALRGSNTGRLLKKISRTCTHGYSEAHTGRSPLEERTSPRQMGGNDRSELLRWRTSLSSAALLR